MRTHVYTQARARDEQELEALRERLARQERFLPSDALCIAHCALYSAAA